MLGIILDTFILVVLIRVITGDEEDGLVKPAIIAVLAGIALFGASFAAVNAGAGGIWILVAAIAGVGVLVAIGCFALMGIDIKNSAIIGGAFVIYKIAISILFAFLFSAA